MAARPILVDWGIEDAQDAATQLIDRLSRLALDVIILDAHPGLMALTDAICREADCNILVSDCDVSTAQANWLLAWEVRHGQRTPAAPTNPVRENKKIVWRMALNRIPSPKTVGQCGELVEEARKSALRSVPNEVFTHEMESETTDPVFLLPELEVMRLDSRDSHSPTSIKRRGGNRTLLATRHLVRRLTLEGITPNLEAVFPYARADNQEAHRCLGTYIENYHAPWHPGWRRIDRQTTIAVVAILFLVVASSIAFPLLPENWPERPQFHAVVGILTGSILSLIFLVCSRTFRQIILECRTVCWFIDASAIGELPAHQQARLYEAGIYPELALAGQLILQVMMFASLLPAAVIVGFQFNNLSPVWRTAIFLTTVLIVASTLWRVPDKSSVLRVIRIWFASWHAKWFGQRDRAAAGTTATSHKS